VNAKTAEQNSNTLNKTSSHSLSVGMFAASGAAISRLAVAAAPLPASTDDTALVTLFTTPDPLAVTLTVNVHDAPAARLAPASETLVAPATAVIVPPPQAPLKPFGVDTDDAARECVGEAYSRQREARVRVGQDEG
jgi:hypothetical protein